MRILIHTISLVRRWYTYIELSGTYISDIGIQPARIQFESCLHLSLTLLCVVFYRPALSMQYQIDKISTIKLCPLPIYLVFTCRKCGIVNSSLEAEVPNTQVLKFCLPKEIDTGQKQENNKISSNH